MRNRNLLITALLMVGFLSPLSTAQVVINMPPPAPKATHVKVTAQLTSATTASTSSTSSTQTQLSEGDIAIRRYVRSRSGPKYTSGMYDYRRYGYGYGYGYGYYGYSPFFFGFGFGHHHHHNGHKSDPK